MKTTIISLVLLAGCSSKETFTAIDANHPVNGSQRVIYNVSDNGKYLKLSADSTELTLDKSHFAEYYTQSELTRNGGRRVASSSDSISFTLLEDMGVMYIQKEGQENTEIIIGIDKIDDFYALLKSHNL